MKSRRRERSVCFVELVGRAKRGSGGKERSKRGRNRREEKKIDKEPDIEARPLDFRHQLEIVDDDEVQRK